MVTRRDLIGQAVACALLPAAARAGLVNIAGARFASSGGGGNSNWIARSTGPQVVWAHNFSSAAEVNNFRFVPGVGTSPGNSGTTLNYTTADKLSGNGCLEQRVPAGGQFTADWWRPFSPLNAAGNGRGINDPACSGALTVQTYDPNDVNEYAWSLGNFNHPDYNGAATIGWDFWIQARMKISASRWAAGQPVGKLIYIDHKNGSNQELIIRAGDSVPTPQLDAYTNFGSRLNSYLWEPQNTTGPYSSLQPGSEYASPPTYWQMPADQWFTMLFHVRASPNVGGSGGPSSGEMAAALADPTLSCMLIEMYKQEVGESDYTLVWQKRNYVWNYDPSPFAFNMFKFSGYTNGVNAVAEFTQRLGEVIMSKDFIPAVDSTPAWFENMADLTWNSTAVTNTINDVIPSGAANTDAICDAWTGGCVDPVRGELILAANGGHGDYGGNEVYVCGIRNGSPAWSRLTNPSATTGGSDAVGSTCAFGDGLPRPDHGCNRRTFGDGRVWMAGFSGVFSSGNYSKATYSFDRHTKLWTFHGNPALGGANAGGWESGPGAYDPVTNKVWSAAGYATGDGVICVDCSTGQITSYNIALSGNPFHYSWSVIANGCWIVGSINDSRLYVMDLSNPTAGFTSKIPTGTPAWVLTSGAVYHPQSNAILVWHRSFGASLKKISVPSNPLTGSYAWSTVNPSGTNTVDPSAGAVNPDYQGCFSKFNMIPDMGNGQSALVVVENTVGSTYVFKLPLGGV